MHLKKGTLMRFLVLAVVLLALQVQAAKYSCLNYFLAPFSTQERSESSLGILKFMTYNVENFFVRAGKMVWTSSRSQTKAQGRDKAQYKSHEETEWIRDIIEQERPDFLFLQEIDGEPALKKMASEELHGLYRPFVIKGNDARGIQVGFLVRTDLPFDYEYITHKDMMFKDPVDGGLSPLFSRDVPALVVRKKGQKDPLFILLGNHAKSKRDRDGDPESVKWRTAQYNGIAQIIEKFKAQFGAKIPIMLAGDFNAEIATASEIAAIRPHLKSAFDRSEESVTSEERVTHTFHPTGGRTVRSQFDDLMMTLSFGSPLWTYIYRYLDKDGNVMPIPETYEQRSRQPSDHFPVIVIIDINELLRQ